MKKLILLSAVFSLFFIGCSDDDEVGTFGPNNTIVGFQDSIISRTYITDFEDSELNVPVGLISIEDETFPGDVTLQWSIDPSSTATAGVEYDMPTSTSVVLPSGNSVVYIPFNVHPNTFDPANPKDIVINLTTATGSDAIIGQQFKKIRVSLLGVCSSALEGNYSTSTVRPATGAIYTFANESIAKTADPTGSEYKTTYVGPYYGGPQTPGSANTVVLAPATSAGYTFTDICGNLKMSTQNLASIYSNEVRQSATQFSNSFENPVTGVLVIHYSIFFTDNTVERPFISTYTPL